MGGSQTLPKLTEDQLEDYTSLTYLNKGEIFYLLKKFNSINSEILQLNFQHRFTKEEIVNRFHVLKNNPFQDRIFKVFSSKNDDCFSFEDVLDMCSAMSAECPAEVKAAWAFRIFDLDDDNQISSRDICEILERLTKGGHKSEEFCLNDETKHRIARIILEEMKLDNSGSIGLNEFKMIMSRLPEFSSTFYFRL